MPKFQTKQGNHYKNLTFLELKRTEGFCFFPFAINCLGESPFTMLTAKLGVAQG